MTQTTIACCEWCGEHAVAELTIEPARYRTIRRVKPAPREPKTSRILVAPARRAWACAEHAKARIAEGSTLRRRQANPDQLTLS